jgi:hypothetical protein
VAEIDDEQEASNVDSVPEEMADALLTETREELGRADSKAATLMSASGVVVSVLLAGAIAGQWTPLQLGWWQLLWWPGAVTGAAGVIAFAYAVWPRVTHEDPEQKLAYFGHVANYDKVEDLRAALKNKDSTPAMDRTLDQLIVVSKIVTAKYYWVRWGMRLLALGLLLCVVAVVIKLVLFNGG